ncbi:inactive serine/threonine-protein kinase VRK3 [Hemibagrus wyckioides]|uniref:inactive serine/threonine-protein kinase VRK3 n=1 Tax=Hemibagrus wyckioides TaxID=337641 RepID=UPI00266BD5C0|nr:inactive serine/threonine-protein kinase VRK3 [Hemibagrus wyckioides]
MAFHYCPQCGSKLQPGFKFCPSCGEKLPCPALLDLPESTHMEWSAEPEPEPVLKVSSQVQAQSMTDSARRMENSDLDYASGDPSSSFSSSSSSALIRSPIKPPLRSAMRKSCPRLSTPPKPAAIKDQSAVSSPRKRKAALETKEEEVHTAVTCQSPQTPPSGKVKRTKRASAVEPVQEGLVLCDQSGKKWTLGKLLSQTDVELMYEVQQAGVRSSSNEMKHIMRLGTKDGQLFNEQNFLQRAAKPAAVERWMKTHRLNFLGIPSSVGFGLHETYRFLIFPDMGCTLQSLLDTQTASLSEREVLKLALRLLDALEYLHENEYAHADLHAGNVYIRTEGDSQVFLSGFAHTFRFCPGGNHVEYREGGRTPHQGNLNFISVDSHKGAGPSRRSDLQSLGFCLLFWLTNTLPWSSIITQPGSAISAQKERYMNDVPELMKHCFKKKKVSGALQSYLSQVMSLYYTEKPNYSELKLGLNEALKQSGGSLNEPLAFR